MRRALAETLIELISKDRKIIFLTGDLGFGVFDELKEKFPSNYLNVGIAESNMIAIAAGLSSKGFKPIVYSIASFATSRPFEFIKLLAGYNSFKIIIVGAGGGLTYSTSGSTHHALDDIGIILGIPGIEVFSPAGPKEMSHSLKLALELGQSSYIRIGKFGEEDVIDSEYNHSPVELVKGDQVAIFSHGNTSLQCLNAARNINSEELEKVAFFHFPFVQNIDWDKYFDQLKKFSHIVVVEEHWPLGGLYSKVLHYEKLNGIKIHRLGPPFQFISEHDEHLEIQKKFGYGQKEIEKYVIQLLAP